MSDNLGIIIIYILKSVWKKGNRYIDGSKHIIKTSNMPEKAYNNSDKKWTK